MFSVYYQIQSRHMVFTESFLLSMERLLLLLKLEFSWKNIWFD